MASPLAFALYAIAVQAHLFMGAPETFRWHSDIDKLIMPMNGDPSHHGQEWEQQIFPCKGFHVNPATIEPRAIWTAGEDVTIQ